MRLGRRPVRFRVAAFYRLDPDAARGVLPDGFEPRVIDGHAVGVVCYTHLGCLEGPFLPHRSATTHHLAYRIAAEVHEAGESLHATWVVRRETSSRFGARLSETVLRREHGRSSFELEEDALGLSLRVESGRGEELVLRAEAGKPAGTLFRTPQDVERFFLTAGTIRPHAVIAPEADAIDARNAFASEPLSVFELRSAFFDDAEQFPPSSIELDGAWRLVPKRLEPRAVLSSAQLRRMLASNEDGSALPAL